MKIRNSTPRRCVGRVREVCMGDRASIQEQKKLRTAEYLEAEGETSCKKVG